MHVGDLDMLILFNISYIDNMCMSRCSWTWYTSLLVSRAMCAPSSRMYASQWPNRSHLSLAEFLYSNLSGGLMTEMAIKSNSVAIIRTIGIQFTLMIKETISKLCSGNLYSLPCDISWSLWHGKQKKHTQISCWCSRLHPKIKQRRLAGSWKCRICF